jgi:hypothetical protein
VDESKLAALTKGGPMPTPAKSVVATEAKAADLAKADEKLSSLLGGKK